MSDRSHKPDYRVYRARRRPWARLLGGRLSRDGLSVPHGRPTKSERSEDSRQPRKRPQRKPMLGGFLRRGAPDLSSVVGKRRWGPRRIIKWSLFLATFWLLLSLGLFLVSASNQSGQISAEANAELGGSIPLLSKSTILVLGSDERPKGSKEPGANDGPARADSIMLMRVGGGSAARLSILRDSYAQIPGFGQQKINAAYAIGGTALAIRTVEQFVGNGLEIDHVILVNFENFPDLIDSMGGIDINVRERCVRDRFGGVTLSLSRGAHRVHGQTALRYARIRKNRCVPSQDDRDRARRQQEVVSAIKGRAMSVGTVIRLPWVSWAAPKTIATDMGGPSLLALVGAIVTSPDPQPRVLKPSAVGPGNSLIVSESEKASEAARFLGN